MLNSYIILFILFLLYLYYVNFIIKKETIQKEIENYITWDDLSYPGKSDSFFEIPNSLNSSTDMYHFDFRQSDVFNSLELCRLFYRKDSDEEIIFDYDVTPKNISRKQYLSKNNFTQLNVIYNKKTGTAVSIVKDNLHKNVYVIFRGTEQNLTDLKTDLNTGIPPIITDIYSSNDVNIHKGFLIAFNSVKDELNKFINSYCNDNFNDFNKLIITGHSLGGALASIFIYYKLHTNSDHSHQYANSDHSHQYANSDHSHQYANSGDSLFLNKLNLITFGSPLVGNKKFANSISLKPENNIRVVNGIDIITKIPFSIFNYKHINGNIIKLKNKIKNIVLIGNFNILKTYLSTPPRILADHSPLSYKLNLTRLMLST